MGALAFLVFMGAVTIIATVLFGTLLPAWPRIVEALFNAPPAPAPRLVLAHRGAAISRRPQIRPMPFREAA